MGAFSDIRVNGDRLWSTLMETSAFGGTPNGGICRLALSEEDRKARVWLVARAHEAGWRTGVDDIGNIYIRRRGRDSSRLPIAIGSHLDTQPTGGKFDGVVGVLAGLEVLRTLDNRGIETEASVCLVNWTNEEGSRFAPGLMGSEVFAGDMARETAWSRKDSSGISVGEALKAIGYAGSERAGDRRFAAMVELHIEQGPILEARQIPIGIVESAKGQLWFNGMVQGRESHAGTTPMDLRRDALTAFAAFSIEIERIARAEAPAGVGTIGMAQVGPGSRNTVPGNVRFSLEFRHSDAERLAAMQAAATAAAQRIAAARGVSIELDCIWRKAPVEFDSNVVAAITRAAQTCGYDFIRMTSGAGHDAVAVANVMPTAMIFVPCKDGISHNEAESVTPQDCAAGANVLLHSVLELAGVSSR